MYIWKCEGQNYFIYIYFAIDLLKRYCIQMSVPLLLLYYYTMRCNEYKLIAHQMQTNLGPHKIGLQVIVHVSICIGIKVYNSFTLLGAIG